jgi:hypothetical protein
MECNYLYGVMPADKASPGAPGFGPIGIDGGEVRVVTHGAIAMVTSPAPRIDFSRLPPEKALQYLAEHQRVLERVMTDSAVIPLKFGTFADDDRQILDILQSGSPGAPGFAHALEQYAGKFEWDLVACWADLQVVLSEIAAEPAVASMKAEVSAHGPASRLAGPTTEQRIQLGQLVRKLLTRRRDRIAAEVVAALRAQWPEIVVNPTKDDAMILHVAVLIGRDEENLFDQLIDRLNRDYKDRLNFRCVGPLPPYSFATAEVRAVDAEELDAARQLLGVGERLSPAEIKAAYRRVLPEVHPDRNPGAEAAERMKELVAAHQLLEEYALNCNQTPPVDLPAQAGKGRPVIVKIRTLPELRARAGAGEPARRSRRTPDPSERAEPLVAGAR